MSNPTLLQPHSRTFQADGHELEHPVDAAGRALSFTTLRDARVSQTSSGDKLGFRGTAIVFNTRTWIGSRDYGYWEQIAPEAVAKTMSEADIRFLQNHNPDMLLARTKNGSLRLSSDGVGLRVDADMAPVSYARDLAVLLERGDMSQMSFAFSPLAWRSEEAEDGKELVTFTELRLWDVSAVTYPAYETTDAGLRAAAFAAMCRGADLDPDSVLREYATDGEVPDLNAARLDRAREAIEGALLTPEQARALEDVPEPAETTRTDPAPPAETTERLNPDDRLREIRAAEIARRFKEN